MKKQITKNRKDYFTNHSIVWISNEIHKSAKIKAAQEGVSLKQLFTNAVNLYLQNTQLPQQ
jgi:predicted HicB family RNase H-like nuclease